MKFWITPLILYSIFFNKVKTTGWAHIWHLIFSMVQLKAAPIQESSKISVKFLTGYLTFLHQVIPLEFNFALQFSSQSFPRGAHNYFANQRILLRNTTTFSSPARPIIIQRSLFLACNQCRTSSFLYVRLVKMGYLTIN